MSIMSFDTAYVTVMWLIALAGLVASAKLFSLISRIENATANLAETIPSIVTPPALVSIQCAKNVWMLEFNVADLDWSYTMFRFCEAQSEIAAFQEGRNMEFNLSCDDTTFKLTRITDPNGKSSVYKP